MIVVDVEASGTEYDVHSIVSVGALLLDDPDKRFYEECRIWEGAHIMNDALLVNGFTQKEIEDPAKQTEGALIAKFLEWIEPLPDHTLAGQNVSFDRDFLRAAAQRAHLNWTLPYRTIDTHTLAYMHHVLHEKPIPQVQKKTGLDLDAVLNYVGIPNEPEPHNALTGALSHAEVVSRLLYNRQLLPEFKQYPIPWN